MSTLRVCTFAILLAVFGQLGLANSAGAYMTGVTTDGSVLTGELVVIQPGHNRFRIVGHPGSFIAPAGMDLDAWDGKPVQVELSRDGRALQISEMMIHVEPIAHSYEVVTGHVVSNDPVGRSFTLAGSDRVYIAPSRIDLRPYADRLVNLHLDEQGQVETIELAVPAGITCPYNQSNYSDGETICRAGAQMRCDNGAWRNLGIACPALSTQACDVEGLSYPDGASHCNRGTQFICERGQWRNLGTVCVSGDGATTQSQRVCLFGGASVANGSSICRGGTTFRCADGQWINVGTACS